MSTTVPAHLRALAVELGHARSTSAIVADALRRLIGSGGLGAGGLDDVLSALHERRVEALLVGQGVHAPGVVCARCGWMAGSGDRCPVDGTELEQREDIVETAMESALGQSAAVVLVRHHDDLGPLGGIGAVLRF
jgi:peptide subunit release factor 1 (eRF1)